VLHRAAKCLVQALLLLLLLLLLRLMMRRWLLLPSCLSLTRPWPGVQAGWGRQLGRITRNPFACGLLMRRRLCLLAALLLLLLLLLGLGLPLAALPLQHRVDRLRWDGGRGVLLEAEQLALVGREGERLQLEVLERQQAASAETGHDPLGLDDGRRVPAAGGGRAGSVASRAELGVRGRLRGGVQQRSSAAAQRLQGCGSTDRSCASCLSLVSGRLLQMMCVTVLL
jgi:hypothetical protein